MPYALDENDKIIDIDFKTIIKGTNESTVDNYHHHNLRQLLLKINKVNMLSPAMQSKMGDKEYVLVEVNSSGLYNTISFQGGVIFIGSTGTIRDISSRMK